MKGTIYLIPNLLGESNPQDVLPSGVISKIHSIRHFVVENTRTARRFLIRIDHPLNPDEINFYELDKHNPGNDTGRFIKICESGKDIGIISEAGMPGIADPGSEPVRYGHKKGIRIVPLTGPSSIFLALSASGLNGQNFKFHGYLPVKIYERAKKIREMETISAKEDQTQIFIETPYRNMKLLDALILNCQPSTLLCIASEITTQKEFIQTRTINEWLAVKPSLHKKPCIFLLLKEK